MMKKLLMAVRYEIKSCFRIEAFKKRNYVEIQVENRVRDNIQSQVMDSVEIQVCAKIWLLKKMGLL